MSWQIQREKKGKYGEYDRNHIALGAFDGSFRLVDARHVGKQISWLVAQVRKSYNLIRFAQVIIDPTQVTRDLRLRWPAGGLLS